MKPGNRDPWTATVVLLALLTSWVVGAIAAESESSERSHPEPSAATPLDWRFGFEDTWSQLGGLLQPDQKALLLTKMRRAVEAQKSGGDVNINGLAGGWNGMQRGPDAPIRFQTTDTLVRLLQTHGFSLLWNLRINAPWASAGNPNCHDPSPLTSCAPDAAHEDHLARYIRAIVERYDGDGLDDMPGLSVPVRFYLMTGEIEFPGATPGPRGEGDGWGDEADPGRAFWTDSIANLLRTHRIVYRAIHDADPTGRTALVSSGGVLWDLYADFPDHPRTKGPTVQARLAGANNHGAPYTDSFARLETMLRSFGDDSDGIECDYVGWHPHMPWREIEQTFGLIRELTGDKPIYIDDMWTNVFLQDRPDAPGNTLFTGGGTAIEGDFPNPLVPGYRQLRQRMLLGDPQVRAWYDARGARHLVKAFVSAFGEGAERVSLSGNADFALDRLALTGYINPLGTAGEGFPEKPAYYTLRLLVVMIHDFTSVTELEVSDDPRTRVYRFERPRGPLYVGWSETGPPPPNLDYSQPNGETVRFAVESVHWLETRPITQPGAADPPRRTRTAREGVLEIRLGYEPVLLEPALRPRRLLGG